MAIAFASLIVRHERRLRLLFTNTVDTGAFVTSLYTVTSEDDSGVSPDVRAVFAVSDAPNAIELSLSEDLASGGAYAVKAVGVPAIDASVTPDVPGERFVFGVPSGRPNEEVSQDDISALLYGVDLAHNGEIFLETNEGDLATTTGVQNVRDAREREGLSEPLAWDPDYGAGAREYVDGPTPLLSTLQGRLVATCLRDDRVKKATAEAAAAVVDGDGEVTIRVFITPIGSDASLPIDYPILSQ